MKVVVLKKQRGSHLYVHFIYPWKGKLTRKNLKRDIDIVRTEGWKPVVMIAFGESTLFGGGILQKWRKPTQGELRYLGLEKNEGGDHV